MTVLLAEDWTGLGGTLDGDAVTPANTAAGSIVGTTPLFTDAPVFDGPFAMLCDTSAGAAQSMAEFFPTTASDEWIVFAFRPITLPGSDVLIATILTDADARIGDIRANSSGTLTVRDNFLQVIETTTTYVTGEWNRVALRVRPNLGAGGFTLRTYFGTTAATSAGASPDDGDLSGASTQAGPVGEVRLGIVTSVSAEIVFDFLTIDDAAETLPPSTDTTDPVAVVTGSASAVVFDVDASGSTDDVGVVGYSWDDAAAGGTFGNASAATTTWTSPDLDGPWTLTCTVSDAAGNDDPGAVVAEVDVGEPLPVRGHIVASA